MKRAKQRKFREPVPMCWFPISFVGRNLDRLYSCEIGMIDSFRIIITERKQK